MVMVCMSLFFLLISSTTTAHAAQVQIAWNQSVSESVTGYKVYHGAQSRHYTNIEDSGPYLTFLISEVPETTPHYIAVTAYSSDAESDFSEELVVCSIRSSSSSNGNISPSGSNVFTMGSSQTFSITPDQGYVIADVIVDGTSIGAVPQYTFSNLEACHTISAVFSQSTPPDTPEPSLTYSISAYANPGGTISPSGNTTLNAGADLQYTITPAANYMIADVTVDNVSVGAVSSYTFTNVSSSHSIAATFKPRTYTISALAGSGGSITPSGNISVAAGADQKFLIEPAYGYKTADVMVDGISIGAISSYTISNIYENHSIEASFKSINLSPVADAGPDQIVKGARPVTLNASNSTAPNGISAFLWKQVSGPAVPLKNSRSAICTFKSPRVTFGALLMFQLTITDKTGKTVTDQCLVNVSGTDLPPVANAGRSESVSAYSIVNLNGSESFDPDDRILFYRWEQTGGPKVSLSYANSAQASFVAPDAGVLGATLDFKLVVRDRSGLKMQDHCLVSVVDERQAPAAVAGPAQSVHSLDSVVLDGSGSYDSNQGTLLYRWKQTGGYPVTLSNPLSPKPTFKAPAQDTATVPLEFRLTVTNDAGLSSSDKCVIKVTNSSAQ